LNLTSSSASLLYFRSRVITIIRFWWHSQTFWRDEMFRCLPARLFVIRRRFSHTHKTIFDRDSYKYNRLSLSIAITDHVKSQRVRLVAHSFF
jgi:hypothetical protein